MESAVKVAAGVPATRPQKTRTVSPGPKPVALTPTVVPGFPAGFPTIVTFPTPPAVMSWADAFSPLSPRATTVADCPREDDGRLNPVMSVPVADALPRPTTVPARERDVDSETTTGSRGRNPLPKMPTWPPGETRPGLSMMLAPPVAGTAWPPSVTVGVGVGLGVGVWTPVVAGGA